MNHLLLWVAVFLTAAWGNAATWVTGENPSSTYGQYTHDESDNTGDYTDTPAAPQKYETAKIRLTVEAGTRVWLTSYVADWENVADLNASFDMTGGNYGYLLNGHSTPVLADGTSSTITYHFSGENEEDAKSVQATAYLLGDFTKDTNIFFTMTPRDDQGAPLAPVDTKQEVDGSYLTARWDGNGTVTEYDRATNVVINFKLYGTYIKPFVAVFEKYQNEPVAGQPLPCPLVAGLLSLGTVFLGKRMKKRHGNSGDFQLNSTSPQEIQKKM